MPPLARKQDHSSQGEKQSSKKSKEDKLHLKQLESMLDIINKSGDFKSSSKSRKAPSEKQERPLKAAIVPNDFPLSERSVGRSAIGSKSSRRPPIASGKRENDRKSSKSKNRDRSESV